MPAKRKLSSPNPFTPVPWSASARGRRELIAAGLFVLAFVTVPLVRVELYPFSRAPMFADAPQKYCEYSVATLDGRELDLLDFGLQRNYWGNPIGVGVGFQPTPSVDVFGRELELDDGAEEWFQARLARFPDVETIVLIQKVVGPADDAHVDVTRLNSRMIRNRHFRGPGM